MNIGDLVKHNTLGTGIVAEISEPTVVFPYQIASVCFNGGQMKELVTTTLQLIKSKNNLDI
jgi:hypothetical protein